MASVSIPLGSISVQIEDEDSDYGPVLKAGLKSLREVVALADSLIPDDDEKEGLDG